MEEKERDDKRDEIIALQMEAIRIMTEQNLRKLGSDLWGPAGELKKITEEKTGVSESTGGKSETDNEAHIKEASGQDGNDKASDENKAEGRENLEDLLSELDGYIGLSAVKDEVKTLVNLAKVKKLRQENNLPTVDMSLHMVFSGNPGTGKTMIARFMARVYHSIGILSKGQLVEVDRSGLVAGYVGQTAVKTAKVLDSALGGVLFIDEAYTLTPEGRENDFGQEAVDTILKYMEDKREDLVVIAAGYTELMEGFINSNPGLRSRFNKYLEFTDYTGNELYSIFEGQLEKNKYTLTAEAEGSIREYFELVSKEASEFGNARGVRNVFEKVLTAQGNRLALDDDITAEKLMSIADEDVKLAVYGRTDI